MAKVVALLLNLYVFTTGRRLFAHRKVRQRAQERGLERIVRHVDEAIAHDEYTYLLEMRRNASPTAVYSPAVHALDDDIDEMLYGINTYLASQARMYGADSERGRAAATIRQEILPDGPKAVASLPYIGQHVAVNMLLRRLDDPDLAEALAALSELAAIIERMRALNEKYGALLQDATEGRQATTEELDAARDRGQELLSQTVVLILAHYVDTGDEQCRHDLLAPIQFQNETIRRLRRRRRRPADIQPDTGDGLGDGSTSAAPGTTDAAEDAPSSPDTPPA